MGQAQDFVDLSLLKKMDGHLEWAMKKADNRAEIQKEEMDNKYERLIR